MDVEFFFMTKSQPRRCYLILSVVLIIIILLSPFNTFTSNDGKVTTLSYSQDQDQDSYWWNAETTITHQDLWLGN